MKHTLLLLFLPLIAFSQTYPDGAIGVKYSQSKQEVIKILQARGGTIYKAEKPDPNQLIFVNLKYGAYDTDMVILTFSDDKLYQIGIFLKPKHESAAVELYKRVAETLGAKYGPPDQNIEEYLYPYERNDGHVETAISIGKAKFRKVWRFEYQDVPADLLTMTISDNFDVIVGYVYGRLFSKQYDLEKQKDSHDY